MPGPTTSPRSAGRWCVLANNINDDDAWWSRPRSKYIPSPLHAAVDVQAAVDEYERMDNVKIRARDVIYASISTWTGFQWKDRGSIPVVRKGQLVNSVPGLGLGNALASPLPLPDHVIDAAFTPNATELKKKREGIEALIASLEAVRAAAAALDVNSWWGLGATWDNRDGPTDQVVDIVHALGLGKSFNASLQGLMFNAKQSLRFLDYELNEVGTGRGRPKDTAAHLVASRYGRLYAIVTGKRPTYGESPDGMAGEFTPSLRDLFNALGWQKKSLRGPAESARNAVTDSEILRVEGHEIKTPQHGLNALATMLPDA